MEVSCINDLCEFLKPDVKEDVKLTTLKEILSLTGTNKLCEFIEKLQIGELLIDCLLHEKEIISKTSCLILVNISAFETGANYLWNNKEIITRLLNHVKNPESETADAACMTLSNLTRHCTHATWAYNCIKEAKISVSNLIDIFTKLKYNSKQCNMNYLSSFLLNLSQNSEFRRLLMQNDTCLIKKLFPFTQFHQSLIRKKGAVGIIRNCCFDTEFHEFLLSSQVDVLSCLLLPLAGPEEFDDEDNDKLPIDLQYLSEEKEREPDSEVRKMLLESLLQLCATKFGREYLREKNAYVILREYHKWEEDKTVLLSCENVVDILIRTEDEINENNIKAVDVPEKYIEKFNEMDNLYIQGK